MIWLDTIWAFFHRGVKLEITTTLHHEPPIYSVWATHATGSAVAIPNATTFDASPYTHAITQIKTLPTGNTQSMTIATSDLALKTAIQP